MANQVALQGSGDSASAASSSYNGSTPSSPYPMGSSSTGGAAQSPISVNYDSALRFDFAAEWDIPIENVTLHEVIGRGTFGTVYRGNWHGEVAVRKLDFAADKDEEPGRVAAFRREVELLHKSRHGNLCLFMGACMKAPDFAILTSFSKGETLFYQLHQRRTGMFANRAINIASQVANGMGYLHAKGILHKDLKTRNIFIEQNSRVLISDYGLFNFVRLCRNRVPTAGSAYLNAPPEWFCSIAPEILRTLNIHHARANEATELPFTIYSDIYAFGTIWYELLTNEFPYKGLPSEAILLQAGKGLKQSMRIPGPKDFKEFLNLCWAYEAQKRPGFSNIVKLLDRMPKLHRSPSYPAKPTTVMTSSHHNA
ncbi:kinase suppressor of Ras 2 [Cichlidogyrus casuarinus]|uniref:Kinase suppressor of Ras 2 n=1 Tax=Cichlidogyrus casuarinus TaxID=1844966 RepID=A0ABD2QCL5_9PLAT